MHTSDLTSPQMRVLDHLLARAGWSGQVRLSLARIGIGAAMSDTDQTVNTLIDSGWLAVLREADPKVPRPRTYQLTLPASPTGDQEPHAPLPPPPPSQWEFFSGWFLVHLPGHDAFRRATGSLNPAYPLLCLLRHQPRTLDDLAALLECPVRRVRRHADLLVRHGLAEAHGGAYYVADGDSADLNRRLDLVAESAGTRGSRRGAIEKYQRDCAAWRARQDEWVQARGDVGSPEWREAQAVMYRERFQGPTSADVRKLYPHGEAGLEQLVQVVIEGQIRVLRTTGETLASLVQEEAGGG